MADRFFFFSNKAIESEIEWSSNKLLRASSSIMSMICLSLNGAVIASEIVAILSIYRIFSIFKVFPSQRLFFY